MVIDEWRNFKLISENVKIVEKFVREITGSKREHSSELVLFNDITGFRCILILNFVNIGSVIEFIFTYQLQFTGWTTSPALDDVASIFTQSKRTRLR